MGRVSPSMTASTRPCCGGWRPPPHRSPMPMLRARSKPSGRPSGASNSAMRTISRRWSRRTSRSRRSCTSSSVASVWPPPRSPRPEIADRLDAGDRLGAPDVSDVSSLDDFEPGFVGGPAIRLSEPRSLARRVGERLAIAAVLLVLAGVGLWMSDERRVPATDPSGQGVAESTTPARADNAAEAKAQQPNWLSPEMFYAPAIMPAPSSAPASAAAPRADVPLPTPRPDR